MREEPLTESTDRVESYRADLKRYASYEDDDGTVICDRKEPNAWLKSDVTVDADP